MNKIILNFKKDVTKLAGNALGKKTYIEQVEKSIDLNDTCIIIVFPSTIDRIASSFIQGFFEDIVSKIGIIGVIEKINIQSDSISNLKQFVIDNLE